VKDGLSTITTVEDVVPHPADGRSGCSWHPAIIKQTGLSVNIRYVPFSFCFLWLARVSSAPTSALSLELLAGHRLDLMLDVNALYTH
jgi:hypothetical protein